MLLLESFGHGSSALLRAQCIRILTDNDVPWREQQRRQQQGLAADQRLDPDALVVPPRPGAARLVDLQDSIQHHLVLIVLPGHELLYLDHRGRELASLHGGRPDVLQRRLEVVFGRVYPQELGDGSQGFHARRVAGVQRVNRSEAPQDQRVHVGNSVDDIIASVPRVRVLRLQVPGTAQ